MSTPSDTFPLGSFVRLNPATGGTRGVWGDVWKVRTDELHDCIVIRHCADGVGVQVWDMVENDWWICDAEHLIGVAS